MIPEKDNGIAKLLDESRSMILRFESLVDKHKIEEVGPMIESGAPGLGDLETEPEPAGDAFFELFVEEDSMTVTAEFRPPAGAGRLLTLEFIEKALFDKEIVHGIQLERIHEALNHCNLDHQLITEWVIAHGTEAQPLIPEHIRLQDELFANTVQVTDSLKDVDFKEIHPFIMVKKGQLLGRRIPEAPGVSGTDVFGREVPFATKKQTEWNPGVNVAETPVGFEADVDGRLVLEPPTFLVNPVLELVEGVDYRTGNIRFRGEVIIHGKVATGFAVDAGGSLATTDTLDAFDVKVGRDLTSPGGIIGNGEGKIQVGGLVRVKFLEHVSLVAQGDVFVENVVMNSLIKTRGRLVLGEKGILAGGQVHALDGVEVVQIGTATGPQTELFVGLDFAGMERITWIRERSQELHVQLKKVDLAIPYGGKRVPELMAAAKKLRLEIVQLTDTAREQLMRLGQNEEATIDVRGTVFPGTSIEICHVSFVVTQKMASVRFFLDKRKGSIGVEPLGNTPKATPPRGAGITKH